MTALLIVLLAAAPDGFSSTPIETLLTRAKDNLHAMGPYRAQLLKRERIRGVLQPAQLILLSIREQPLAVRAEFSDGPAKGRRALYDSEVRSTQMLVREAGLLGVIGSIWLSLSSDLAKRDTNYGMTDVGLTRLIEMAEKQTSSVSRHDEGWDAEHHWCIRFEGASQVTRICFETERGLPVRIERSDASGLFESFEWSAIAPLGDKATEAFSREAADL